MNLQQALAIVRRPLRLNGVSHDALAVDVNQIKDQNGLGGGRLYPVPFLDGGTTLRVSDVLLRLAVATQQRYYEDLYDYHTYWGLLRYLGFFDDVQQHLALSEAGHRVVGNQRRVASEELGIGFATFLAGLWMQDHQPGTATPRIVDVDVALTGEPLLPGGARHAVRQAGRYRPDYLLISDVPGEPDRFRVAVVECKGTKKRWNSYQQLAGAARQLSGITLHGNYLTGLAVSTVLNHGSVAYYALQHYPDKKARDSYAGAHSLEEEMDLVEDIHASVDPVIDVELDVEAITRAAETEVDLSRRELSTTDDLAAVALRGSWAMLGDLAGNPVAFDKWAPKVMRTKLRRASADRPRPVTVTVDDLTVVGVRNVLSLPGGQLDVVLGIEANVDEALSSGNAAQVLAAQRQVATSGLFKGGQQTEMDSVVSVTDDGAAMILTPR